MLGYDSDSQDRLLHPPLFIHFPNLLLWNVHFVSDEHFSLTSSTINSLRSGLQTYCSKLKTLDIDELWIVASHFRALLSTMAPSIETLRMSPIIRSRSYQMAHSLTSICIHHIVGPPAVTDLTSLIDSYDEDTCSDTIFATIVETCPQLRVLSIFRFITTVQPFEKGTRWACKDLEVLRVMVREIKCPDQVDACLAQLKNLWSDKVSRPRLRCRVLGLDVAS